MSYDHQPYINEKNQNQNQMGHPPMGQPVQQPYQQPYQQQPQVVVVNGPALITDHNFCRVCNRHTQTKTEYESGLGTWLICLGFILFGLWLGCCLIPFCVDELKDKKYICMQCGAVKSEKKLI